MTYAVIADWRSRKASQAGYNARKAGKPRDANNRQPCTVYYDDWADGWDARDREEQDAEWQRQVGTNLVREFVLSLECAAGCERTMTSDQKVSEILTHSGSAVALAYQKATAFLHTLDNAI